MGVRDDGLIEVDHSAGQSELAVNPPDQVHAAGGDEIG